MKQAPDKKKLNLRVRIMEVTGREQNDKYLLFISVFLLSGIYFLFYANYIFFYQENRMLFVFSSEYFRNYFSKPGGLLEYAGNFLSQGYFSNLYGAVLQAVILTTVAIVFLKVNDKNSTVKSLRLLPAALASGLLLLMQVNINYRLHNDLGFLLAGLYFLISISCKNKISKVLIMLFFPVFFYMTGAYAWIYLGMITVNGVVKKNLNNVVCFWIIAVITLLISKWFLFLQPWSELIYYPLPPAGYYRYPVFIPLLILFFVLFPLFPVITVRIKKGYNRNFSSYYVMVTLFVVILVLIKTYSRDTSQIFRLEKMFFPRDWNGVISYQEAVRNRNLVAEYYYNTALAEKGILCDRMFFAPQDYGTMSVMIPWSSEISMSKIFRGIYFYYSAGLFNEAHRWAFESMVTEGFHPENIKLLIKTNLINGHYKIAEKYIRILKKTLHYRRLAIRYEAMLKNPRLIESDPELGEKIRLKPKDNFLIRIRNPEANINSLLHSNPGNVKALEYRFACLMLERDVEGVVRTIDSLFVAGYSALPGHVEEAALFYQAAKGPLPGLIAMKISNEAVSRFSEYLRFTDNLNRTALIEGSGIPEKLRHTYWYYLDTR